MILLKLNRFNLIIYKELKNRNRNDYKSTQEPYLQLTRYTPQPKHSNLSKKETEEPLSFLKTIWIPYNLHHLTWDTIMLTTLFKELFLL